MNFTIPVRLLIVVKLTKKSKINIKNRTYKPVTVIYDSRVDTFDSLENKLFLELYLRNKENLNLRSHYDVWFQIEEEEEEKEVDLDTHLSEISDAKLFVFFKERE